jgi:hypothetical protein
MAQDRDKWGGGAFVFMEMSFRSASNAGKF